MARLFPRDFDINQTCALVESVARVLSEGEFDHYVTVIQMF